MCVGRGRGPLGVAGGARGRVAAVWRVGCGPRDDQAREEDGEAGLPSGVRPLVRRGLSRCRLCTVTARETLNRVGRGRQGRGGQAPRGKGTGTGHAPRAARAPSWGT